jgi:AraC-like DNA-binding protein
MRVSAIHVRALVEALAVQGVSAQAFIQRAHIEEGRLSDPYAWFTESELDAFMQLALELTQDPAFGLHWGEHSPMMQYDLLASLIPQAKSLQAAIEAALRFQPILADRPELEFRDGHGSASFYMFPLGTSALGLRFRSEMIAIGILRLLKSVGASAGPQVTRVAFRHACPAYRAEYERIFGSLVCFGQPESRVDFRYDVLDRPAVHRNAELFQVLEVQAERVLKRVTDELTYSERLKRLVQRELPRLLQMPDAARSLGMSERSLRRRLAEEDVSYSQLVEQSQIEVARLMLENPSKSIKEVAHDVGFTGQSGFHRAFKRWTGTSPAQFRARK